MARFGRGARIFLIAAAALVAVLIILLVVLTRTDFGVEQAGRFAVERLRSAVNGDLRVGNVTSRGLLRGVTLHDVAIDDEDGRPFLRADSARLAYHLRTLVGGDLAFDRLTVYAPEVTIERLPGQTDWNFRRVFPGDTIAPDTAASGLVLIDDASVFDGRVIVRLPWEPELPVDPGDTARILLEDVPGGVARVFRFEEINGRLPRIVWDSPDEDAQIFRIGHLATRAYIWDTPVEIRRVEGTVTLRDSILSFHAPRVQLPGSELDMAGQIIIGEGGNRYDIEAEGDDVSFADFQWLYPPLPRDGGGSLTFRIQSRGANDILWLAEDARLRTGGTEVAGSFGVVTGDSVYFTNVSLEASPLDLQLLQSLLPGTLPLEGLLIGTVEVEGPISALRTRGDVRYRRLGGRGPAESAARWAGTVRARKPYAVSGLDADLTRVDLGQIAELVPALRLRGLATGTVRADGSLARGLRLDGEISLDRDGSLSTVRGGGEVAVGGNRSRVDLRLDAEPLALDLLGSQFPALARLTGEARGAVTLTGSLDDLEVDADIVTPAGGVEMNGTFVLVGPRPRFTAEGAVTDFRLDRVVGGLPITTMTGRFDIDAAGQRVQDLEGRAALDIFSAVIDGIPLHAGKVRVRAIDGVALVDTVDVRSLIGDLAAAGSLGLAPDRTGQLRFALTVDTLAPLERHLLPPLEVPDTAFFPAARLAGAVTAEGTLSGSLRDWTIAGRATASRGVYGGIRARRAEVTGDWTPAADRLTLSGRVDSLTASGRFLPAARIDGRYEGGAGSVVVAAQGSGFRSLEAAAGFTRVADGARFSLRSLALETRDGRWELDDTVAGMAGSSGFGIEPTLLTRQPDGARIQLAGVLPWRDPDATGPASTAAFTASVENLRLGEVLRIAQTDTAIDGILTGRISVSGTAVSPVMAGGLTGRGFRYHEATLDSLAADLRYRDRSLSGHVAAWRGDERILRGDGAIPVDLALAPMDERRLDQPMEVRIAGDSVPAALVAFLAPGFTRVQGTLDGAMVLGGTARAPRFHGELRIMDGSGYFTHSGVHYRQVAASATMRDTELSIYGTLRTGGGAARIRGLLDLEHPRDPGFDLELVGRGLEVSRRRDVVAVADSARVFLRGRYSAPVLSGSVRLTEGELNLGEILRQYRIVQLEPWFYEVFDSTSINFRPPEMSPFLANIRVSDASVTVDRGFWLRGPELDVEVSGQLGVEYDRVAEDLRLSGTLQAVRGTYELRVLQNADFRILREVPGRRFDIRSGAIDFVGTPGIDPNLAITATYRLRRNQGEPIDVVAQVAGTLQTPRVRLTSESDLPISESDLASYIIFGRSLSELTQSESDVLSTRFDRAGALFMDAVLAPTVSGLASSTLQSVFGFDHVAVTTARNPNSGYNTLWQDAQLEFGTYFVRGGAVGDLFLVGTVRLPGATQPAQNAFPALGLGGVRAEWRFRPTWTSEFFFEDRFARTPSFGLQEIEDRRVWGLSLFREWAY